MEVTRCQTLLADHDIVSQASIGCKHGFFLDDLLICNKHGFKILKLKQDVIPQAILTYDHATIKTADLAHSCEGWYHYALEKGYFQTIEECFPRHYWAADFDEINYEADIAGLQQQLDDLALINMLDQEFVDSLQSGGAAYTEIAAQVAAESTRAQGAESSISSAFAAADSAQTTALLGGASTANNTLKKLADSVAAESTRATGAEAAILGSPSANFNTLEKQENEHVSQSAATAANFVADRDRLVLLEATYSDTEVDAVCDAKIAALVNSAPAALDTLNELAAAISDDASFSTTMNTALSARVLSTTYTAEQTTQNTAIAGKQGLLSTAQLAVINANEFTNAYKQKVDDAETVLGTRSAAHLASLDTTSSLTTALATKAMDSVVIKKTGQQTITQAGTGAVLTLQNTTGDADILSCVGADGTISLSGGNVLSCDRPGAMYIRSSDGSSNIAIQSRGTTKFVCDDQVRSKTDFSVENQKKVKFYEATSGGTNSISLRAPAAVASDVTFTLPAADGSAGQVIQTNGSGALSFAAAGVSLSAANAWTGTQTFDSISVKKHVPDIDTTHDSYNVGTATRQLGSTHIGKLLIWDPTSAPSNHQKWGLPEAPAVGTMLRIINANRHNGKELYFTTQGSDELYKTGLSGALSANEVKLRVWQQSNFLYCSSGRWTFSPQY